VLAAPRSFYVTNAGDDTVTYYAPDGSFPGGSQAASTYPVGADPTAVAVSGRANAIYVANQGADSVSILDARSGIHAYGSVAASIPVEAGPSALAVDPSAGLVYVANRGSDSVTFLDALTGAYAFGSLAASTFAVGDEPGALAFSPFSGVLAVANFGDDTVTLLDAATGAYAQGNLIGSTFAAGPGIAGIAATPTYLLVTNGLGDTMSRFDPATGLPWFGSLADSTMPIRSQPGAATGVGFSAPQFIASLGDDVVTVLSTFGPWYSIPVGSDPVALAFGLVDGRLYVVEAGDETVSVYDRGASTSFIKAVPDYGCAPGIAHSPATGFLYASACGFYPTHGVVTFLDPSAPVYAFGTNAASAFDVGDCGDLSIAVNDTTGTLYVTTYGPFLWSDEHVVFLDSATGSPKFGTLAASRFSLEGRASNVATSASADRVYVAEAEADAVTFFDATTGAYIGGTLAGSMVAVGGSPMRLAVNETAGLLFVSVPENDAVVMLDATTGTYANGTLAASTIAVGATPRGLTYESTTDVLYVANLDDDSVTMLDGTTGAYRYGTLPASTFPAHDEPEAVGVDAAAGILYVANGSGLTVHDAATGAYINGALSNSAYRTYLTSREQVLVNAAAGLLYLGGYRFGCTYEEVEYLDTATLEGPFSSHSLIVTQPTGAQPSGVAVSNGIASNF
jgi:YVTN family beta-propeller protein